MHSGNIPPWLQRLIDPRQDAGERLEIEVKFLLRRAWIEEFLKASDTRIQAIEQVYLPFGLVRAHLTPDLMPQDAESFEEWRIRQSDDDYFLTAKRAEGQDAAQRLEYEVNIPIPLYDKLLAAAEATGKPLRVTKTRYSRIVEFSQQLVLVQVDDYQAAGKQSLNVDFVTCEVEVPDPRLAHILRSGRFFAPDLHFLHQGIDLTGIKSFSNRQLAEHGFIAQDFAGLLERLRRDQLERLRQIVDIGCQQPNAFVTKEAGKLLARIECFTREKTQVATLGRDLSAAQDVLKDLAFSTHQSLGRPQDPGERVRQLDAMGKGWL
ncbi:MAG: hypothetical protein KJN62_06570, partial [Deltaproteobacteria bacterium]|nr:hypothetical protein [Deltaproteobacteria bacterium]